MPEYYPRKSNDSPWSSISITGFCSGQSNTSVTIQRAPTFPALRVSSRVYSCPVLPKWAPRSLPTGGHNLKLELLDLISAGRSGVVYSARVTQDSLTREQHLPDEICIKVARPQHCRSLARDAWFHEQLANEGYSGAVSPLCFGFFSLPAKAVWTGIGDETVPENLLHSFVPWVRAFQEVEDNAANKEEEDYEVEDENAEQPPPRLQDLMLDDTTESDFDFQDDHMCSKRTSQWNEWELDPDNPTLAVLLLEKLGDIYPSAHEERCAKKENMRADVCELIDDLSHVGILHTDVRRLNVLSAEGDSVTKRECPRHGRIHKWRVIDFDRARRVIVDPAIAPELDLKWVYHQINDVKSVDFQGLEY